MVRAVDHSGVRASMGWRITGQARIERILTTGRTQHLTLIGPILAVAAFWHGVILMPGWLEPTVPFTNVLAQIMPLQWWGVLAMGIGAAQFSGYTVTYLGLGSPLKWPRILVSAAVVAYFTILTTSSALAGFAFAVPTYLALTVLSLRDLSNAMDAD